MELIIGTNEANLRSYKLVNETDKPVLEPGFTSNPHTYCVTSLAASDKFVASGSHDETINIFNMKKRQEYGSLKHQNGSITCLEFFDNTHLFSGSEDGTICIWAIKSWECVKTLRGHKAGVTDLSVHHSGKLAVSTSKDKTLRTWNLVRGRSAYVTNIKTVANFIQFSPNGSHFILGLHKRVDVYSLETASVIFPADFGAKVEQAVFLTDELLAICGEKKDVEIYDIAQKTLVHTMTGIHEARIKSMVFFHTPGPAKEGEPTEDRSHLATMSSDGLLKVWEVELLKGVVSTKLQSEVDTHSRPVCLTMWNPWGNSTTSTGRLVFTEPISPPSTPPTVRKKKSSTSDASDDSNSAPSQKPPPAKKAKHIE